MPEILILEQTLWKYLFGTVCKSQICKVLLIFPLRGLSIAVFSCSWLFANSDYRYASPVWMEKNSAWHRSVAYT